MTNGIRGRTVYGLLFFSWPVVALILLYFRQHIPYFPVVAVLICVAWATGFLTIQCSSCRKRVMFPLRRNVFLFSMPDRCPHCGLEKY
jgi:hypothetical protein